MIWLIIRFRATKINMKRNTEGTLLVTSLKLYNMENKIVNIKLEIGRRDYNYSCKN